MSMQQTCPHCGGTGSIISDPCKKCSGAGRVEGTRTLNVKIPAGMDTGDRLRLAGQGEAGIHGGPAGDIIIYFEVKPHPIFTRQGNDLYCEVPISYTTAALGGTIEVPTLDGRLNVTIKPETQTGTVLRLSGKGVKSYNSAMRGHLFCNVVVETPVNLTDEQKELLQQFENSINGGSEETNAKQKSKKTSKHWPKLDSFRQKVGKFIEDLAKK